ncbi:3-isopropylmalate dehydratase small subunit [Novosphingobium taihuense]|uniref:3-isopropylmalate dehydratase n=1 Tax=Novosphingobium taihuense TaxID=260085 RepID=A0A7W7ADC0_9SPHN|nr:3-isopropylmalate dehydratase small subunit [Novosphingobium taihuense]MBB4614811.1 3-isopropylmalate dehydratase small subunit [Novosphingobium taihuense]TWH84747.1 3-isopropylmalate/(R)-2-methylmalate dehydratase small subunit [Novosphingobium taihuense]
MTSFTTVTGPAAAMPEENIDTDIIFPARFLLLTAREGLGAHAFHDRRYHADGSEVAGYVLNTEPFRAPPVIVTGANFGSGSSREQAVWALHGLGVRAVIAPALGEIFHNNCLRNGIVPIILPPEQVADMLASAAAGISFTVNLEAQTVTVGNAAPVPFDIQPERRLALLNGWDETDLVLARFADDIATFEAGQRKIQPWLYPEDIEA